MLSPELRWLFRQAYPLRQVYYVRLASVAVTSCLYMVDPLILKWLIDEVLPWRKTEMLLPVAAGFFLLFLFRFAFASISRMIDSYTTERLMFDVRQKMLRHLQKLSPAQHLEKSRGETLHRIEHDIEQISALSGATLASLLRILVMTTLSVTVMLLLNWKLTLLILPLVPLMAVLRRYSQPRLKRASERVQKCNARRYEFLEGHLALLPQVQLLNRQAGERRRFARIGRVGVEAVLKRRGAEIVLAFSYQVSMAIAATAVLGFGGYQVLLGTLTVGGLVAFYSYLNRIFDPLEAIVHLYSEWQRSSTSIRRVMTVFDTEPTIVDPTNPTRIARTGAASVELRGVGFSYREKRNVLEDFHLSLRPGERVALVGTSGSGKSTVARLLSRQYEPDVGQVLIDGVSVDRLRLRDLRLLVAVVPQDPVLFDTSLGENLRFAGREISDRQIAAALSVAQLERSEDKLPEGLVGAVGPRGERLSGGQRQRVAVARAVLQQPRLLILDEATSALDGLTERRLLRALDEHIADTTVLVIAHRMSAVRWADRIVMVDAGQAIASGTHSELLESCHAYRQLCESFLEADEGTGPPDERSTPQFGFKEAVAV